MRKFLVSITLVGLFAIAVGMAASAVSAADLVVPRVTVVAPSSAYNDIDTRITITGADFVAGIDGTATVSLQGTPVTDVTWVDTQTLTATVPWGMNAGAYALTVTNPGGGTFTLPGAFEVKPGIGQWNAGDLFGGVVTQLLLKPRDPGNPVATDTVYALANGVGLFRSRDAGESWRFIDNNVVQNADFALDPSHPTWLYSYSYSRGESEGLWRSENEGDTWIPLSSPWAPGAGQREVFVSPHNANILFLCSHSGPDDTFPTLDLGLKKSVDAGIHWSNVTSMSVQSVAFDPVNASNMVLVTSDARVFRSTNGGTSWLQSTTPSATVNDLGSGGFITYNPHEPGEVWVLANGLPGGIFRSQDTSLTGWEDVTPGTDHGPFAISFPATDTVVIPRYCSTNDGDSWSPYGPMWFGSNAVVFAPDTTQTAYISDNDVGVRKTTDGGLTWPAKNQGLTGLRIASMDVSRTDPLRVYAAFSGPLGMYLSGDGTTHWAYHPISDFDGATQVFEDPFDPQHVYAVGGLGLYESTNTCETWTRVGWNLPSSPWSDLYDLAPDPHHEGRLLAATLSGPFNTGQGRLYSSDDGGLTWQGPITTPEELRKVTSITFDPEATGTVYVTTFGTGLFSSTNSGVSWTRIDDRTPRQRFLANVAIATHPRHVLMVQVDPGGMVAGVNSFRSVEGGPWQEVANVYAGEATPSSCVFADSDSTLLYAASPWGLYFSGDMGDTWTPAAGALGKVEITGLNWGKSDGHILIYAATNGGDAGTAAAASKAKAATSRVVGAAPPADALVGAGIYRKAQITTSKTVTSSGSLDGYVLESSHTSSRGGSSSAAATTFRLGDDASKKQYRAVLSFGTSSIPDSAVITGVTLKFRKQGVTGGGDPVAKFGGLMADVKKGYFGTRTTLQTGDFQASASKTVGAFKPSLVGGWYSINLTSAKAYINKTSSHSGLTQIRLRFKLDDNGNRVANYLRLYSGNAPTSSRPQLIVTYYLP